MKKTLTLAALILFGFSAAARAVELALVYENDAAVTAGRSWPALVVDGGAAVPSASALAAANTLLYGDGDGLFRGQIARLDNDLNIAVVRRGERVGDQALQTAHAQRWQSSLAFLNVATATAAGAPGAVTVAPTMVGMPFILRIDGTEPGQTPVILQKRFDKSKFTLEVVNTSTVPVWSIQVDLSADPKLSFWKEGRHTGLNDIPTKTFSYTQQSVFTPIKPGAAFSVPVEVYFIKEHDYVWNFKITPKGGAPSERKALVRFE